MNFRVVGKNTLIYAAGNSFARVGGFLLIPFYTHLLPMKEFGLLATLLVTLQGMSILMTAGTQKGFIRFAHECEAANRMGKLLGSTIAITLAGAVVVTALCLGFFLPFFRKLFLLPEAGDYVLLTCWAALFQSLFMHMTSYYRARNEGLKFVAANLSALCLLILTNLLFLWNLSLGIKGVLWAQIATYGSLWFFLLLGLIARTGLQFSKELARNLLRFGFPLLPSMLWDLVMDASGIYLLGYLGSLEEVAIYSLGYRIAQIAYMILILPFQLAYEPFVYSNLEKDVKVAISKLLTYLMFGYSLVAFVLVFFSRSLLAVMAPPSYSSAFTVVFLMLPGIAFVGVYYVAESLLGIVNRTSIIGVIVTLLTFGGLVLNYLLIPQWGMHGTIFVFNVVRMLSAILLMVVGLKLFPVPLERKRLGVAGGLFVCFMTVVFFLREADALIYYTVIPLIGSATLVVLYRGNLFDEREKRVIRNLFQGFVRRSPVKPMIVG